MNTEHKLSVTYGGKSIPFRLMYSARKSLEIAVHPDGRVFVKAPMGTDRQTVEHRVHKRANWISRQLRYFEQFAPRTPPRRFVGGESHLYLGRKYRLKIVQSEKESVLLKRGFLLISAKDVAPARVEKVLGAWYRGKAGEHFARIFEECWHRHHLHNKDVKKPALKIRNMKTRWGSLSGKGAMTLNSELIKAPSECIEYIITHELCHLLYPNHGREFYNLLEARLPDWKKRKHALELVLS